MSAALPQRGPTRVAALVGLHRAPVLTAALTVVTATVSIVGLAVPSVTAALERSPAAWHGEPWRWVTSLVVQDGGIAGTVSNLLFLVLVGAAAEQVVSRRSMAVLYLAGALAGQLAGVAWQPVGAGNSIAVCGLAGGLAWCLGRREAPPWAASALALWLGALLATWWTPLILVGVAGTVLDRATAHAGAGRSRAVVVAAVVATAVVAAVLVLVANIHGAALAAGLVLAVPLVVRGRRATPS